MPTRFQPLVYWVLCILLLSFASCAGKSRVVGEEGGTEAGQYLLYFSNFQGNPICMYVSMQKARVDPWIGSPKTRWRVHSWLAVPGVSRELFFEKGKNEDPVSAPLSWTKDTLLFSTDSDQFVFYRPADRFKLLLVSDPIFPDRVRRSRAEEVHFGLIPSILYWNNLKMEGRVFCEKQNLSVPKESSTFPPLTGPGAGGGIYAIWEPDGVFLYVEQSAVSTGAGPAYSAVMQDRRGRWQETYDVRITEPPEFSPDPVGMASADVKMRMEFPFWKMSGDFELMQGVVKGVEAADGDTGAEGPGGVGLIGSSLEKVPTKKQGGPLTFCLFKGTLFMSDETKSVYGVWIQEK